MVDLDLVREMLVKDLVVFFEGIVWDVYIKECEGGYEISIATMFRYTSERRLKNCYGEMLRYLGNLYGMYEPRLDMSDDGYVIFVYSGLSEKDIGSIYTVGKLYNG